MRATLLLAAVLLTAIADMRPPEYDEAYSIFLTAGNPRPAWPGHTFHPADVRHFFAGASTFGAIARNLRGGDVHPPLYFWILNLWRHVFGSSWFIARLLSVFFSLGTVATLAQAAKIARVPVIPAILIALLAYAFGYTSTVARDFALAQLLNTIGLTLALASRKTDDWRLAAATGLAFGAASFANYLAIFTPLAILFWMATPSLQPLLRRIPMTHRASNAAAGVFLLALLAFLPLDWYFFSGQQASRHGQFQPFHPLPALALIAKDSGAAIFGGLPVYAGPFMMPVALGLFVFFLICLASAAKPALFTLTALATPAGLFLLGLSFNNTPIEIRYLAFSIPSIALILATLPAPLRNMLIILEALGTIGLAFAPATMQPQGLAAREAAAIAGPGTVTLIPYGNDGVGIPGPFIEAAPDNLTIQIIQTAPRLAQLPQNIILATIGADDSSRAAIAATLAALAGSPCWRRAAATPHTQSFIRICTPH